MIKNNETKMTFDLKSYTTLLVSVCLTVFFGCGGGEDTRDEALERVNACNEITPEFNQGIYGCVTTTNDVGSPSIDILSDFTINLYSDSIATPTSEIVTPLAGTKSNQFGYYELPAPPGEYWLCTSFFRCTSVTVLSGEKLRENYDFGPGPGW